MGTFEPKMSAKAISTAQTFHPIYSRAPHAATKLPDGRYDSRVRTLNNEFHSRYRRIS